MTAAEFFSQNYLLNPNTPGESRLYIPLIILFGTLIIFAVISKLVRNPEVRQISGKYFVSFLTIGILGLFYLFFRYEELPYLGSRLFLLLILLALFVWITVNSIWAIMFIPKYREQKKKEERYKRYLPKKKKV
ncbi:MAG: hypothetical protein M1324_00980 [Patescibacteria group bacterium]|nr:hypothetical protein [Patescibacteria group bacterium]